MEAGKTLSEAETKQAHEACQRALAAIGSIVQKHQFQEAGFAVTEVRP